jgi:hypothetical protein
MALIMNVMERTERELRRPGITSVKGRSMVADHHRTRTLLQHLEIFGWAISDCSLIFCCSDAIEANPTRNSLRLSVCHFRVRF